MEVLQKYWLQIATEVVVYDSKDYRLPHTNNVLNYNM